MSSYSFFQSPRWLVPALGLLMATQAASANGLATALESAWPRHPAARAAGAAQALIASQNEAAERWLAGPPSLQLSHRSDALVGPARGLREDEASIDLPLRLPAERQADRRGAQAQAQQLSRAQAAARWALAGELREAWWASRLAATEQAAAQQSLAALRELRVDVERRLKAGDLARLDLNQALSAEQGAQAALAEATAALAAAQSAWALLVGPAWQAPAEPALFEVQAESLEQQHPARELLQARLTLLTAQQERARAGRYAGPSLALGWQRERGMSGEPYAASARLSLTIPLGAQADAELRLAQAGAERAELEADIAAFDARQAAALVLAQSQVQLAEAQLARSQTRQALAADSLGLQRRAFALGAIDLPTRLRAETEQAQADLALARSQIEGQRSASRLQQSRGLTP